MIPTGPTTAFKRWGQGIAQIAKEGVLFEGLWYDVILGWIGHVCYWTLRIGAKFHSVAPFAARILGSWGVSGVRVVGCMGRLWHMIPQRHRLQLRLRAWARNDIEFQIAGC